MNIAICTNISNGIGLAREYELLKAFLEGEGHAVFGIQFDQGAPSDLPSLDLMISLETVARDHLILAPHHWWFPNPEWTYRRDLDIVSRHFSKVLCKTKEAERIFAPLFPDKTHFVGFLTRDQYDRNVPRRYRFLHVGGNSSFRGTQAVLDAWKWKKNGQSIGAELVIVSQALQNNDPVPGVAFFERASEEELKRLQNECLFHLYPSGTEGFGHALHEALSVNALILTTDAAPMNEIYSAVRVPVVGKTVYNLAEVYEVSALDIFDAVRDMMAIPPGILPTSHGREEWAENNALFENEFGAHLQEFSTKRASPISEKRTGYLQIAFLGNFEAPESTENLIRWALENGHAYDVIPLQENTAQLGQLEAVARYADLFLWVRTPNWLQVRDEDMLAFLKDLRIPSVSLHLDKFWGIPEREALIGVHPFWKTDAVFTADGSRQEDFKKRGVKHHWMKPAMSEVYLHPGVPRTEYFCDVGFVGAKGYHAEYPFRARMLDFLQGTYRGRFRHIEGIRGHALNDVYASMKVVVGDCFAAGTPYYWSDRLAETTGRYGFLLHPQIEGMRIPVATYKPQDLDDLRKQIDRWLPEDDARREITKQCAEYVREHDTWTRRMWEILDTMNLL